MLAFKEHSATTQRMALVATYFRCSPLVLDFARKTTVQTAKIKKTTVRAPTPVEPTSSMVPHAVTVSGMFREPFVKRHPQPNTKAKIQNKQNSNFSLNKNQK
jgi:hypothetical protein